MATVIESRPEKTSDTEDTAHQGEGIPPTSASQASTDGTQMIRHVYTESTPKRLEEGALVRVRMMNVLNEGEKEATQAHNQATEEFGI
jgi:hypothetical protein